MMVELAILLVAGVQGPSGPVEFGIQELRDAIRSSNVRPSTAFEVVRAGKGTRFESESYQVAFREGKVQVEASDENGTLYGLLEAAERIRNAGKNAWKQPVLTGKPYLAERGLNIFLPLPWDYEKNFVDNDPAALTDPNRWFFHNEDYWRKLFRMMALSRLNWLDIHGPYDLDTTRFPNLYAYFIQSEKFPKVGVDPAIKKANLERLRWIIKLAHQHGIKVSLMSYEARFDIPHNLNPGYRGTEAEVYDYTKEVVEKMIRQVPELDKLGFRIGESGRGAEFFNCYLEAVKASGRKIPLYTRSWVTRKARVVPLARESEDFTVEIKYNGEQWGAPYIMAGGRTANWYSYWYEDYLSDSGKAGRRMWPGNEVGGQRLAVSGSAESAARFMSGGQEVDSMLRLKPGPTGSGLPTANRQLPTATKWPSQPYKIVWQVRANGTHRIFPFYQPEWTRRSILSMKLGTATGYTVESTASYFPQEPKYYWQGSNLPYRWTFERDEMYMACWGRLGYDPDTPEWKFDAMVGQKHGKGPGQRLASAWKAASRIVPTAFMAYGLGPDHRSHAPELETGGDLYRYIEGEPFDSHVFMSAKEAVALRTTGGKDGRLSPSEAARILQFDSYQMGAFAARTIPSMAEHHAGLTQVRHFGNYVSSMLHGAEDLALAESGAKLRAVDGHSKPSDSAKSAADTWQQLSESEEAKKYRPFTDRLRMHRHDFHWSTLLAGVREQEARVAAVPVDYEQPTSIRSSAFRHPMTPPVRAFGFEANATTVRVRVPAKGLKAAWLLEKPLPSSTFFHRVPMGRYGGEFMADFKRESWGHAVAAEVEMSDGTIRRIPWWQDSQPYRVVPSQAKPTPPIYSSEEAMSYLKPEILDPAKHGWLLVATRGEDFHRMLNRQTQRKLLLAVERGMNLLVMQQDFLSGRYPLDWLPVKPRVANRRESVFDPGGALGLEPFEMAEAMWQPFEASPGWTVHGNGAMASYTHGKGTIWMMQGRLVQRMQIPAAARNLKRLLEACSPRNPHPLTPSPSGAAGGGNRLPVVLVDAGSEGDLSSSVIPDFMNAHDIPFLTLGEVVAKEQGMDSFTVVPGPTMDDDILDGKGKDMANKWLRDQVIKASRLQAPATKEAFEIERKRRKSELLRSLGLDPMPPRTPLNARITGTIQGKGYKIEKLVYESRPRFHVTAHLYLPDPMPPGKLPVIVHVNGHWAHKKGEDRLQLRSAFSALNGYIALTIDSPGWSFEGTNLIERRAEGNHNDWFLVQGGTNATGYYVWDVMRGLDYLETRPDADMARIGITGASGGGLATLYAFAAEDRFRAAVPVVYMSSMELAPDNGCLCNHVPATCQVGDRSDVLAIQAPKPVYIFGAENDPEFPPDAMRLTGKKMAETWKLFGKEGDALTRIFEGPHDYNQPMREAMIGFFDKHLKGKGDGSPVAQSPIQILNPEDRSILVLDPPPADERTMRDLSLEYLANAPAEVPWERVLELNGGRPEITSPRFEVLDFGGGTLNLSGTDKPLKGVFEAQPGLKTPAVFFGGNMMELPLTIVVSDDGKAQRMFTENGSKHGRMYMDILGTGELAAFELRYPVYLGRSPAFLGAIQIVAATRVARQLGHSGDVHLEADGPLSGLSALYAGLIEPRISKITSRNGLKEWADAFKPGVSPYAVQPRAHLMGSLESLRRKVKNASWEFRK